MHGMRLVCLVGSLVWGKICSIEIEIYLKINVVLAIWCRRLELLGGRAAVKTFFFFKGGSVLA